MISLLLFLEFTLLAWTIYSLYRLWSAFALYCMRKTYTAALDPPSVSVCIPARNEMHAMAECLERVLASDYKKLEIIVYDDSSADETSLIVRSFAHAGVRFVAGSTLPAGWLGKNYALDVLAREASGTYVIFMDVDTHIKPSTISLLVSYIMTERLEMISVLPRREDIGRASVIFGTLRYFWLLVLPWVRRPVSSGLWMTERTKLMREFNGIANMPRSVTPEATLANQIGGRYATLLSSDRLGVSFEKKLSSQYETSQRLLFPLFNGRWYGALGGLLFMLFQVLPLGVLISSVFVSWTILHTFSATVLLGMVGVYGIYLQKMWRQGWWYGMFAWPVLILQELGLFILSVVGYARGTIFWKDRSVTKVTNR